MISAILIFGQRGEVLSSRIYKDGLRRAVTDVFRVQVISNPDAKSPLLTLGSTTFLHIRHEDLYIVAVARHDVDAALIYELLYRVVDLGTTILGSLNETSVAKNVSLMYELLDEIVDFGYPQNTDYEAVRQIVSAPATSGGSVSLLPRKNQFSSQRVASVTSQVTSATSWRRAGIKYRRNEVFLDVLERVNLIMNASGNVLQADVNGQIMLKSQLSGMPTCHIGLNNHVGARATTQEARSLGLAEEGVALLEDFQLHQSVELSKFNKTHDITFIPPDGEFELMRYRVVKDIKAPFVTIARVNELDRTRVEYDVQVTGGFDAKMHAADVMIRIPVPPNAAKTSYKAGTGKVKYNAGQNVFEWRINRFVGNSRASFTGVAELTPMSHGQPWNRPPITLAFSLNGFSSSGLNVRYLKVIESSNYNALKWVRYATSEGAYEIRI